MRRWSLGHLTVASAKPHELVQIAAKAGYEAVDPFVGIRDVPRLPMVPLKAGDLDTIRFADELRATGMIFNIADAFALRSDNDMENIRRTIALVGELGAQAINAILFDPDLSRGTATVAAVAEYAREHDLPVLLEFIGTSTIASLEVARQMIEDIGAPHVGIMVDALHLAYTGASPADLRPYAHLIRGGQLCDAPIGASREEYERIMIEEREIPGTGELPLVDLMAELPPDLTCAIEVPRLDGADLVARAKTCLDAARELDKEAQDARRTRL